MPIYKDNTQRRQCPCQRPAELKKTSEHTSNAAGQMVVQVVVRGSRSASPVGYSSRPVAVVLEVDAAGQQ
jgi:hypothetical protein